MICPICQSELCWSNDYEYNEIRGENYPDDDIPNPTVGLYHCSSCHCDVEITMWEREEDKEKVEYQYQN